MSKDYKKLYEEALERAKYLKENTDSVGAKDISYNFEYIFPELHESEDERIRKDIIVLVEDWWDRVNKDNISTKEQMIAWLEKQGEQKPIEQDIEVRDLWVYIREWNDKFGRLPNDEDELASCIDYVMKRQKPADEISIKPNHWKPSEEQMDALNAINILGELSYVGQGGILVKLYNDLLKL